MRYEIINPSDKCYITAEDPVLAKIACCALGRGWYGLKAETGEVIIYPLESLEKNTGMRTEELTAYLTEHAQEIVQVFRSFEYETERTSMNDIGGYAARLADALENKKESDHETDL